MRWQKSPLQSGDLAKMAEMALNRQNRQTVNKNSNTMAKGPFGKRRYWRKWRLIAEIAKLLKKNENEIAKGPFGK